MRAPERILVATDFSKASELALAGARVLAQGGTPQITIAHVLDAQPLDERVLEAAAELQKARENAARERLEQIRKDAFAGMDGVDTVLIRGRSVAEELCRFAEEHDTDVIVIATHGRTGLSHLLIGSVAERVVRHAPCPVFTLRSKLKS